MKNAPNRNLGVNGSGICSLPTTAFNSAKEIKSAPLCPNFLQKMNVPPKDSKKMDIDLPYVQKNQEN